MSGTSTVKYFQMNIMKGKHEFDPFSADVTISNFGSSNNDSDMDLSLEAVDN